MLIRTTIVALAGNSKPADAAFSRVRKATVERN